MKKDRILWADDEIELLKPHVLFLENKGYEVVTVTNGLDALEQVERDNFDLIFLDENMPGISGLETLTRIKENYPTIPVIMITKSEEEDIMNQAIGGKIADYLIKPVNPSQIILSIKKNLHKHTIVTEQVNSTFQQEYRQLYMSINDATQFEDWVEVYKKLVFWDLKLENGDKNMLELLQSQKEEANRLFARFVAKNYLNWMKDEQERPMISPDVFKRSVFPIIDRGEKVFVIVIDNFRLDQWKVISPLLVPYFNFDESYYCSILPTATQYSRNAIFSGLMPIQIKQMFPDLWVDEDEDEGKNLNESVLIETLLERFRRKRPFTYNKINEQAYGEKLLQKFRYMCNEDLNVLVINFIDMLSHARTDSKMIRELASSDAAYRSVTKSWFQHSFALELFKEIAARGYKIVLTSDHGTVQVKNALKIIGDKAVNTNLRYKVGKMLSYPVKEVFEIKDPQRAGLPSLNLSSTYIFAQASDFFSYQNNFNHYASYYRDTLQHGGISLEEMIIPIITLEPK